ncbi:hypothetical protein BDN67DRAFT_257861 [Paxillus ammoniavirescens]|nr:hypothetical protein BDN67DRAFT_257861 [Paxillus ammoniavirescens]
MRGTKWQQCPAPPMRSLLRSSNPFHFLSLLAQIFCSSPNQYVGYPRCSFVDESSLRLMGQFQRMHPGFRSRNLTQTTI